MLISKKNRREVYKYLFKGALVDIEVCVPSVSSASQSSIDSKKQFAYRLLFDNILTRSQRNDLIHAVVLIRKGGSGYTRV